MPVLWILNIIILFFLVVFIFHTSSSRTSGIFSCIICKATYNFGASLILASENTQSWDNDIFGGFTGIYYVKVIYFGKQMIQLGSGPKIYYDNIALNPTWGIRTNVILLFSK